MQRDKGARVVGIVLAVLSALLVVGVLSFAGPCGVHDDGSVSSCFWAARAVLGVGVVLLILSVVRLIAPGAGERRALSLALANLGALAAALPGGLIDLCMMQTMRCNSVMRPFVLCVGAAIAVVGAADVIVGILRGRSTAGR